MKIYGFGENIQIKSVSQLFLSIIFAPASARWPAPLRERFFSRLIEFHGNKSVWLKRVRFTA